MNVLKALNEDRFNKVLINVNSINIINPCEIEIVANSIAHQVKNTNGFNLLPFQCVLVNNNAKNRHFYVKLGKNWGNNSPKQLIFLIKLQ